MIKVENGELRVENGELRVMITLVNIMYNKCIINVYKLSIS